MTVIIFRLRYSHKCTSANKIWSNNFSLITAFENDQFIRNNVSWNPSYHVGEYERIFRSSLLSILSIILPPIVVLIKMGKIANNNHLPRFVFFRLYRTISVQSSSYTLWFSSGNCSCFIHRLVDKTCLTNKWNELVHSNSVACNVWRGWW